MIKKLLQNCSVSIGKEYFSLSGEELKTLLYLKIISNSNNSVFAVNISTLSMLMDIDKRSLYKHINVLISNNFIEIEGDIKKCCSIKLQNDETFELFDSSFLFNTINELDGAELKLYCILTKFLNKKVNKNYIYPNIDTLVKEYYHIEHDSIPNDKFTNKKKNIENIKNKLIEKGYIKKVAAYYFVTKEGDKGKSTLGYFLKIGDNEVSSEEYFDFVHNQINQYNNNHKNELKLAAESYLTKCKYKNLDKYICYRDIEVPDYFDDYEIKPCKPKHKKKTIFEILKEE